jgi:hypothetical protein
MCNILIILIRKEMFVSWYKVGIKFILLFNLNETYYVIVYHIISMKLIYSPYDADFHW